MLLNEYQLKRTRVLTFFFCFFLFYLISNVWKTSKNNKATKIMRKKNKYLPRIFTIFFLSSIPGAGGELTDIFISVKLIYRLIKFACEYYVRRWWKKYINSYIDSHISTGSQHRKNAVISNNFRRFLRALFVRFAFVFLFIYFYIYRTLRHLCVRSA